eukprot:scaffold48_cov311-Pinguiococcus_pyrenoidosus.AAC.232
MPRILRPGEGSPMDTRRESPPLWQPPQILQQPLQPRGLAQRNLQPLGLELHPRSPCALRRHRYAVTSKTRPHRIPLRIASLPRHHPAFPAEARQFGVPYSARASSRFALRFQDGPAAPDELLLQERSSASPQMA